MLYIYQYDIAALALTLTVLMIYLLRRSYPTTTGRIFVSMLIFNLFAAIFDVISAFTISYAHSVPIQINYIVNIFYLLSYNLSGVIFYKYVLEITKGNSATRFDRLCGIVVAVVDSLLIVTTPFSHLAIYFDDNLNYCHADTFILLYVLAFFLLIRDIILFVRYKRNLNYAQSFSIVWYVILVVSGIIVQYLNTSLLISSFVVSLVFVLMYNSLERPSDFQVGSSSCYNERAFNDRLGKLIKTQTPFTIVAISIEGVDYIGRILAHEAIESLTYRLIEDLHRRYGRRNVFCIGTLQFAVITHGGSETVIEKLCSDPLCNVNVGDVEISIAPYFCVLRYPDFITSAEDACDAINISMQRRTESGGGEIVIVTKDDLNRKYREIDVLNSLRRALKSGGFEVYYQPIYDTAADKFTTAEALIRLQDPVLGIISPTEFIPIAEKNGLIVPVGEMVLESVCRFWTENKLGILGVGFIHVNLSALQCMQDELPAKLRGILEKYDLPPKCIDLEITETAAASNEAIMTRNIERVEAEGFSFSLDDFGTGYSNIEHLVDLPLECVKIDKGILWKAMNSSVALHILSSIIDMIKATGKKCIVEGVETEEMRSVLDELGCDYYQGYLFSKPLPGAEFLTFLKKNNSRDYFPEFQTIPGRSKI